LGYFGSPGLSPVRPVDGPQRPDNISCFLFPLTFYRRPLFIPEAKSWAKRSKNNVLNKKCQGFLLISSSSFSLIILVAFHGGRKDAFYPPELKYVRIGICHMLITMTNSKTQKIEKTKKIQLLKIISITALIVSLCFSLHAQDISQVDNIVTLRDMAVNAHMESDYAQLEKIVDRIEQVQPGSPVAAHYRRLIKMSKEPTEEKEVEQTTSTRPKPTPYFTPVETQPLRQEFTDISSSTSSSSKSISIPWKNIAIYGGAGIGAIIVIILFIKIIASIKGRKKDIQVDVQEDNDSLDFSEVPQANADFDNVPDHLTSGDFDSVDDVKNPSPQAVGNYQQEQTESFEDEDSMPVSFGGDSDSLSDSQQADSYQATPTVSDLDNEALEENNQDDDMDNLIGFPESDISEAPTLVTGLDSAEENEEEYPQSVPAAEDIEQQENSNPQEDLESVVNATSNEDTGSPVFLFDADNAETNDEPTVASNEAMTFELGSDVAETPQPPPRSTPASDDDLIAEFNLNDAETLLDIGSDSTAEAPQPSQESQSESPTPFSDDAQSEYSPEFEIGDDLFAESNETQISEPLGELPDLDEDDDVISFDDDNK